MCTSISIANFFIEKAKENDTEMSLMKLIKLSYIAHGWHLSLKSKALFDDEVQAWQYGPVIPKIYDKFREQGMKVTNTANGADPLSDEKKDFLNLIWNVYGCYTGIELSAMTHKTGTAWFTTWYSLGGQFKNGAVISNDLIKIHYDTIRRERGENQCSSN